MNGRALLLAVLLLAGLAACGGADGIPAKTVVLTFDDGFRNHLETVVPILEEHGFGATFFATAYWVENPDYLKAPGIAKIHERGFEIGSHSFSHGGFHLPNATRVMPPDLKALEDALEGVGVPRPVSFAWPGGAFGPEGRQVLLDMGYEWGRRVIHPEFPPGPTKEGIVYDPEKHDPLLIPTWGLVNDRWSMDFFADVVSKAVAGKAVVLCFHGVPDRTNPGLSTSPELFREMMDYLDDHGYRGIAMRDLEQWVDPKKHPDDPLAWRRCPE
jgi:peptidoglycan/xylan/chitin deacetylase (PgdA/CDA1 family)